MTSHFITTPIYYVNDLPHIGHIFTTTVVDTLARYWRMAGHDVFFLTGTDEHGQKIERAARKEGITPLQLADRVVAHYRQLRDQLGFSYDDFVRTTEDRHTRGVEELIRRMDPDDFYTAVHEGWYCSGCETFYTEKELLSDKRCPVHETPVEWKSEQNIFFRLSKYQQPLLDLYEQHPEFVRPESRLNEVRSFVSAGLRDLSVSRSNLEWGIPFPGHPGQTIYVWLDALANYITAIGFGNGEDGALYRKFWEDPDSVRVHMMGKDILRFHAVYWPAFLLSAKLPLPTTIWAHGWWQRDGRKMSKSTGNVVRPGYLIDRFGPDGVRYFFLREMAFGQDSSFSDEGFIDRYNSDLANDLGNTVSRTVTLARKAFDGKTPPVPCDDNPIIAAAAKAVEEYHAAMKEYAFQQALEALWRLLAEINQYVVTREPWALIKNEGPSEKLSRVLWNALEGTRIVATALLPFMPRSAGQVLTAIGCRSTVESFDSLAWGGLPNGADLPEPKPIFPRIDKEAYLAELKAEQGTGDEAKPAAEAAPETPRVSVDQFFQTELKVATVVHAEAVPKSNKLLKLTVDVGEGAHRTVVAGIALAYKPEDLVGKQVVVVANLQPAKLMGIESNGMVLAASLDGKPVLLHPAAQVPPGTRVK
jgi:methionyl-tRNA synthetase